MKIYIYGKTYDTKTAKLIGMYKYYYPEDSHFWLEGVSAPIDGEFYNWKGERTMYPGEWGIAEEDVNCLCWLTFS